MSKTKQEPMFDQATLRDYLETNPDLFQRHPDLLELISLSDNRGAASLLEKQVEVLKQQIADHKHQQQQFMQVVRENEQISDSFTDIVCDLIAYKNLSEFASEFPLALKRTFDIDEVTFKTPQSAERRPSDAEAYDNALRRLPKKKALCDNKFPSQIMNLFFSSDINSAALIPLITQEGESPLGILALGSTDPDRYSHDLGTAHLDRLGRMAGICLSRLQPASKS